MSSKPHTEKIIHQEIRKNNKRCTPGHWFFHEGQFAYCAEAGKSAKGDWVLTLSFESAKKPNPIIPTFTTLHELKAFLADYFECDVVRGTYPSADDLF
jgi:hypothetical protein